MNLKELRMWHHGEMNKHNRMGAAYVVHRAQADFHLAAIMAIADVIGGSVEQDIKDAEHMAAMANPYNFPPMLNSDFTLPTDSPLRQQLYRNPKAQTVPEKIRSFREAVNTQAAKGLLNPIVLSEQNLDAIGRFEPSQTQTPDGGYDPKDPEPN